MKAIVNQRINIVDALRGFALAGIVIVHIVENYVGAPTPENTMQGTHIGILDSIVDGFIFLFLRGKFFALFSFLFGLSFYLQLNRKKEGEDNFIGRFIWRLVLLFLIGYVHSLFYRGDILTVYALLGVFLVLFYKVSNKWVLIFTGLMFIGLGRFTVFLITHGGNIFIPGDFSPNSPLVLSYFEAIQHGSLWDVFKTNAVEGHLMKMDFQLGVFSRGYITFGFFLLGMVVGRLRFFENFRELTSETKKVLIYSIVGFFVSLGLVILVFSQLGPEVKFDNWLSMLGLTFVDLNNIFMTFILICVFVIAYRKNWGERVLNIFVPYGKMALTNYFIQSIIGTFIFFGWGLGYLGTIPNSSAFLLALLIIGLQVIFSKLWLSYFTYGPLEWLWRSATYFKWFKIRKEKA
ncbi:DUF418 domain-containing protein [Maribacter aestuarii]|uniref:DUF418 domain-containing protein n=1 Tax=Maribacter aestuarii TaxID=1130723 RepID=UPI00248CABE2|nr:DUF418 domain-containing protein [Maribacter aestuarii]